MRQMIVEILHTYQKNESKDIKEPRIYYGTETNSIIVTSDNNVEFDYPKTTTQNVTNNYKGERRNFIKLYR